MALSGKEIKGFEKSLTRLFLVGQNLDWISLCDNQDYVTLRCEVIAAEGCNESNDKYGWDIIEKLGRDPKEDLLLIIQNKPRKLLHVFEKGDEFSVGMISELNDFYHDSEYVNVTGAPLLFPSLAFSNSEARISGWYWFGFGAILIGLIAFSYFG